MPDAILHIRHYIYFAAHITRFVITLSPPCAFMLQAYCNIAAFHNDAIAHSRPNAERHCFTFMKYHIISLT